MDKKTKIELVNNTLELAILAFNKLAEDCEDKEGALRCRYRRDYDGIVMCRIDQCPLINYSV